METQVFEDIVHLLKSSDWLYNYPMTQVFTRDMLMKIPMEWKSALQDLPLDALNGLPQCLFLQHWPSSLKVFLQECQRLSCLNHLASPHISAGEGSNTTTSRLQIPQELTPGLTAKKKHEITTLLNVIKEMLAPTGSKYILDIGSGKGYIDSCIHRILHTQVLGVEGNGKLMRSAEKHHWKLYGRCRGITFLNWQLSDTRQTLCRAEQLVSYLTELDTSCSCQISSRRSIRGRRDGDDRTKSNLVCGGGGGNGVDNDSLTKRVESCVVGSDTSGCSGNTDTTEGVSGDVGTVQNVSVTNKHVESCVKPSSSSGNTDKTEGMDCDLVSVGGVGSVKGVPITNEHAEPLTASVEKPDNTCLLLGLHACADLSPIIIKVFRECPQVSSLVLLSCCYHKMSPRLKQAEKPMSEGSELENVERNPECSSHESPAQEQRISSVENETMRKSTRRPNSDKQKASSESKKLENVERNLECSSHESPAQEQRISSVENETMRKSTHRPNSDDQEASFESYPSHGEEKLCEESEFVNFPMSQSLQDVFRRNNFNMSVFGLRLGAQKSGQNWGSETLEDHEYHMRNVAYRGLLEAACLKEDLTLQKLRRRCVRRSGFEDFEEYKKNIFEHYEFESSSSGDDMNSTTSLAMNKDDESYIMERNARISAAMDICYEEYKHHFSLIEPLTGLQLALQPVIEVMVQLDRLSYLKECGFSNVWLEKVFDGDISPRNIALLALR